LVKTKTHVTGSGAGIQTQVCLKTHLLPILYSLPIPKNPFHILMQKSLATEDGPGEVL
jgi:hypothetical protein